MTDDDFDQLIEELAGDDYNLILLTHDIMRVAPPEQYQVWCAFNMFMMTFSKQALVYRDEDAVQVFMAGRAIIRTYATEPDLTKVQAWLDTNTPEAQRLGMEQTEAFIHEMKSMVNLHRSFG
jgi:hypothetical protein